MRVRSLVVTLTMSGILTLFGLAAAGPSSAAAVNLLPSTPDQPAATMPIVGFAVSDVLLVNVSLQGAPAGTTFRLPTTTGLTPAYGYTFGSAMQEIGFTGTQASANAAIASMLISTGAVGGGFTIDVMATVSAANTYYFAGTGHYYQYFSGSGITWTNAKTGAATKTLNAATGYLATITTAVENAFIATKVNAANIWIGATDQAVEGTWKWDAGPEAGTQFWSGNFTGSTTPPFNYAAWASGQPDNLTSEDFAATNWQGTLGTWVDLSNNPTPSAAGYLVEFSEPPGGFTGVSSIVTSADVDAPGPSPDPSPTIEDEQVSPAPWLQSYGRPQDAACRLGWHPSWAQWAVASTGGWVCNRAVYWNGTSWSQNPNWVWGSANSAESVPWDGT